MDAELIAKVASRYERVASRFYARGKLGSDPIAGQLLTFSKECDGFGSVLDVGCGRGQMGILLLLANAATSVHGLDWDEPKVEEARAAAGDLDATFAKEDFTKDLPLSDTVLLIDVLHYLTHDAQADLVERAAAAARRCIVIRELDPDRGWRSSVTRAQETVTTFFRYNVGERVAPRAIAPIVSALEEAGFITRVEPSWGNTPFSNVAVLARK